MTRDEAVNELWPVMHEGDARREQFVDGLVALGLLKLEKPKAPEDVLRDKLGYDSWTANGLFRVLSDAGLKVVRA